MLRGVGSRVARWVWSVEGRRKEFEGRGIKTLPSHPKSTEVKQNVVNLLGGDN